MAGESGKRSSTSQRSPSQRSGSSRSAAPFALLPLGKHLGKSAIALTRPVVVIGSRESCRIHLNSSSVSQQHALLVLSGGTYYVHDLASRNHVIVSETRYQTRDLEDGDELKIGSFILKFTGPSGAPAPAAPAATLQSSDAAKPMRIEKRALLIGRRPGSDITLADGAVSTSHAVIFEMDGQRVIRDLGSRTGTWVNGVQVHQHVLNAGDRVKIGPSTLHYQLAAAATSSAVESIDSVIDDALSGAGSPALDSPADPSDVDFGLDFLTPEPVEPAASTPSESDAIPVADSSTPDESTSNVRRGWRAVVAEPLVLEESNLDSAEAADSTQPATQIDSGLEFLDPTPADGGITDGISTPPAAETDEAAGTPVDIALDTTASDHTATIAPLDLSGLTFQSRSDTDEATAVDDSIPLEFSDTGDAAADEAEKRAAEKAAQDQAAQDQAERERIEAEELAAKQAADEAERQRIEAERIAAEDAERQRVEAERLAAEEADRQRIEAERLAAEEVERQRIEAERIAAEEAERQRIEAERIAAEEAERRHAEAERIALEAAERQRVEDARIAAEEAERQRIEAERIEASVWRPNKLNGNALKPSGSLRKTPSANLSNPNVSLRKKQKNSGSRPSGSRRNKLRRNKLPPSELRRNRPPRTKQNASVPKPNGLPWKTRRRSPMNGSMRIGVKRSWRKPPRWTKKI